MSIIKSRFWGMVAALNVLFFDQITKYIAMTFLVGKPVTIIPGFLDFRLAFNTGVSFSAFKDLPAAWGPYFLSAIGIAASLGFLWWMGREPRVLFKIGLGLVIGGAIGNVIDRLRIGAVIDFISVYHQNWYFPIFNVADSAITIGVMLLLFDSILDLKRNNKAEDPIR